MFKSKTDEHPELTKAIKSAYVELDNYEANTSQYAAIVEQLVKLENLKPDTKGQKISKDALVAAGASLFGIVIIVTYEHVHPIASKALGFVLKTKI